MVPPRCVLTSYQPKLFSSSLDAVTTKGGNMVITLSEEPINGLNFKSAMIQSWNKFCFTTGYIEGGKRLSRRTRDDF